MGLHGFYFIGIFINNASLNQGAVGTVTGQLQGSYSSSINVLSIQYTHSF
jgi:hypothetical protein